MERLRKATQGLLIAVAVLAAGGAAYSFVESLRPEETEREQQVSVSPRSGPVGMRPFLGIDPPPQEGETRILLCHPDDAEGDTENCAELGSAGPGEGQRIRSEPIPAALGHGEGEREVRPGTYAVRAGPDDDGAYPLRGWFEVEPFAIGTAPDPESFADVDPGAMRLGDPREIARRVPCRPTYAPDGRLLVGATLLDPATGVGVDLDLVAAAEYAWSPDGERLALLSGDRKDIRVAEPDGAQAVTIAREARGLLSSMSWSPDGERIAYVARSEPGVPGGPGPPTVHLVDVSSGESRQLAGGISVAWAPVGQRLAVETDGRIDLVSLDGERQALGEGRRPTWAPDGSLVGFLRAVDRTEDGGMSRGAAWVARSDGGGSVRLIGEDVCGFRFSPSGRSVAVVTRRGEDETTLSLRRVEIRDGE